MIRNLLQIVACYLLGLVAVTFLSVPYAGVVAIAIPLGGILLTWPILILILFTFAVGRRAILRYLRSWCIAAPFATMLIWLYIEWSSNYSHRGHDIHWYLSLRNVWERAALVFICSSISAALFWYWNRHTITPVGSQASSNA
jgi:hypothetical protein